MFKLTAILALAAFAAIGVYGNFASHAIVIALLGVLIAGLTAAIAGLLILTNLYQTNYEKAFRRSFRWGVACGSFIILIWTASLDILSGGLTVDLIKNLWYASVRFGFSTFAIACAVMLGWGVCLWRAGKKTAQ